MVINLSSVDLIAADGSQSLDRINLLIKIAAHSSKLIKFNSIKIFTGYPEIQKLPKNKKLQYIPTKLHSVVDYSKFVLTRLHEHIDAEYCLIFQHDGFILNPNLWSDRFLDYDYIGALFPEAPWSKVNRVGNGGFSLRSKKLMKYCSNLDFDFSFNEDKLICVDHYNYLCDNGFSFAPEQLASKFSLEEDNQYNKDINKVFGFHGSSRRPHLYSRTLELINQI